MRTVSLLATLSALLALPGCQSQTGPMEAKMGGGHYAEGEVYGANVKDRGSTYDGFFSNDLYQACRSQYWGGSLNKATVKSIDFFMKCGTLGNDVYKITLK